MNPSSNVLLVAHPGHEVLLHGWMEKTQPLIMILTDGSGHTGETRTDGAITYAELMGLTRGPLFARFSDQEMYEKIVEQDFSFFTELADEVTNILIENDVQRVVADSAEGYQSVHDLCRMLANCAIARAERITGRTISNYDYPVIGGIYTEALEQPRSNRTHLDAETFERKLAAVQTHYPQLFDEIKDALATRAGGSNGNVSLEMFRTEYLRPVDCSQAYEDVVSPSPFYERHGERRASEGVYKTVIRYEEHMLPIARSLRSHATTSLKAYV